MVDLLHPAGKLFFAFACADTARRNHTPLHIILNAGDKQQNLIMRVHLDHRGMHRQLLQPGDRALPALHPIPEKAVEIQIILFRRIKPDGRRR